MPRAPQLVAHRPPVCRCLAYELEQDVLVLTPEGDAAGFSPTNLGGELVALGEFLREESGPKHLLVDLEDRPYFGSQIIGALARLATAVGEFGGRVALVNASPEVTRVLSVMRLHSTFEHFDSREQALSKLVAKPGLYRSRRMKRTALRAAVPVAVLVAIVLATPGISPFGPPSEEAVLAGMYDHITKIRADYDRDLSRLDVENETAVRKFVLRYRIKMSYPLSQLGQYRELHEESPESHKAGALMFEAVSEGLRPAVLEPQADRSNVVRVFDEKMQVARKVLDEA